MSDVELCPCGSPKGENEYFHRKDNHDCRFHHSLYCKTCITVREIYAYLKGYAAEKGTEQ